jgi:site-specific recombinase XerD
MRPHATARVLTKVLYHYIIISTNIEAIVVIPAPGQLPLVMPAALEPRRDPPLADLIAPFVLARRATATRRCYAADLREFVAASGVGDARRLLGARVEDVLAYRLLLERRGASAATIARKLTTVRSFYEYCRQRGWVERNPAHARLVEPPAVSNESTTPPLSRGEVRAVLDATPRDSLLGKRDYAVLMLLAYHGLRRAELAALTPASFGEERGFTVLTIKGKGDKVRRHTVKPQVLTAVRDYLETDGPGFGCDGPLLGRSSTTAPGT